MSVWLVAFPHHHHITHADRTRSRPANSLIIIRRTTFYPSWYVHRTSDPTRDHPPAHTVAAAADAARPDDDGDDFDEDSIPAFTHPQPSTTTPTTTTTTTTTPLDKGKGRAKDTLLPLPAGAAASNGTSTNSTSSSIPLAGNIGTPVNGNAATPKPKAADRRTVGGVRVETRYVHGNLHRCAAPCTSASICELLRIGIF